MDATDSGCREALRLLTQLLATPLGPMVGWPGLARPAYLTGSEVNVVGAALDAPAPPPAPLPTGAGPGWAGCSCGEPSRRGVVHRACDPCYVSEPAQSPPASLPTGELPVADAVGCLRYEADVREGKLGRAPVNNSAALRTQAAVLEAWACTLPPALWDEAREAMREAAAKLTAEAGSLRRRNVITTADLSGIAARLRAAAGPPP